MKEAEAALELNPEEEVEESRKGGRLASLVRPIHDVQVRLALLALAEIDAISGEYAVARKVKALQTHQGSPASGPA